MNDDNLIQKNIIVEQPKALVSDKHLKKLPRNNSKQQRILEKWLEMNESMTDTVSEQSDWDIDDKVVPTRPKRKIRDRNDILKLRMFHIHKPFIERDEDNEDYENPERQKQVQDVQNILAPLIAEIGFEQHEIGGILTDFNKEGNNQTMSLDEMTDVNNEIIRKGKVFRARILKGARERLLSNNIGPMESADDRESLHLSISNIENEIASSHKFGKMRMKGFNLDYLTGGQESGGFITQVDESATDNDYEYKSIFMNLNNPVLNKNQFS